MIKEVIYHIDSGLMDNPKAIAMKKDAASNFKHQLILGVPTTEDEQTLQKLKQQLLFQKVKVKLYLAHTLHAKLYLLHRRQEETLKGYVGSSNLTLSGLSKQGELNVDVVEQDAALKLSKWFDERWNDRWCIDISKELIQIIDESWVQPIPPYYIYLKIAYHLSQEARSGINNYMIPKQLQDELLPFQANAVSVAARHLDKRNGVLISDVVGLGKTLTATAVAKLFEESFFTETLVICPKNLVEMWEDYKHKYGLRATVISISKIGKSFIEKTRRYRVVIIDESHNLRNRQGKKYALVKEYIEKNESRVILVTATPYNKTYFDISSQLRLFIPDNKDIGITPERFIADVGGPNEFIATFQYSPSTIMAFEKSQYAKDWQELLKLYMVRRTRSFIKENYAAWDSDKQQYFIEFKDGKKNYFPTRIPKAVEYEFNAADPNDIYVKLYSDNVVATINSLHLSRYGLGNYLLDNASSIAPRHQLEVLNNLSRAGKRLMGFCRTNLFKRLESSGLSFLVSLARHVLKNQIFIYALENKLPFPIGPQESAEMDEFIEEGSEESEEIEMTIDLQSYREKGKQFYYQYRNEEDKYNWVDSDLFNPILKTLLEEDTSAILQVLSIGKNWNAANDKQLNALYKLCVKTYPNEKILIFTQFADTANYLFSQFAIRQIQFVGCATGATEEPTALVHRFSPKSNNKAVDSELRILITTDILSEGQNLQDSHIIVNYDLPWAIIRLIQRAGRVDRIGQECDKIFCYSFLPQEGIERIIRLRNRLTTRITENSEVVGSDETFFDGDPINIRDLYSEKSGILDENEGDVDLTSQAYEIWNQ
ncbi:MAG TPA: helicase-related protein, partial [Candidatus Babeliaceae bacterium]|nr:helicase-related protein [Candidatus Babeliaceae bacterium]